MNLSRIVPILLIVLMHLLLLQWVAGRHHLNPAPPEQVLVIHLFSQPTVNKFVAAPHRQVRPVAAHRSAPDAVTELPAPITDPSPTLGSVPNLAPATEALIAQVPQVEQITEESSTPTAQALLTAPPPSARYLLDVVRSEPNVANPYYGSGEIQWRQDGQHYTMRIEVGVDILFTRIRLYSTDSEGTIADTGVRPTKMTEARRGRSATATHFNYASKQISFSASTSTLPMQEGAQDRATISMQLASIGNGSADQFQNGKEFNIQVAEDKDAAIYQFLVLGQETLATKLGQLAVWHLVRPPRAGAYSARLDIWLAPSLNWLPVQIRNTEANGAVTTQTIRQIISGNPP